MENASQRKIQLVCGSGIQTVDLGRFLTFAGNSENPFVSDGCVIQVQQKQGVVTIFGAVNRPGSYELLSGEKLYDIIQLAMGIAKDAYLENIEIVRFVSSSDDTEILSKSLAEILKNPKSSENILLQPDDHIFVKQMKDYHLHQSVSISGEVKFPSIFTIEEGKTRLLDIIEKAGGVTADADLSLGQIIRQMWIAKEDPTATIVDSFPSMDMEGMFSFVDFNYLKLTHRHQKGIISVDFEKLINGDGDDQNIFGNQA